MKWSIACAIVAIAAMVALPAAALAASPILTNGSFEIGYTGNPSGDELIPENYPATAMTGWTVTSGDINWVSSGEWAAEQGSFSVDMNGEGPGAISQTFPTVPNTAYVVQFWLAGNMTCPGAGVYSPAIKVLDVSVTGAAAQTYDFDTTNSTRANPGWTQESYSFTATGSSTTLTFASESPSPCGPAIDNVTVDQAPAITSANGAAFTAGQAGSFTVTTSGVPTVHLSENGSLPSGVTFTDNGDGTATLAGTPAAGTVATYALTLVASNGTAPDASQSFTLTVGPAASTTQVSSNPNPSVFGQSVTFTAAVAPAAPNALVPTGKVAFSDGSMVISSCTAQPVTSGEATCTVANLAVGTHTITAAFTPSSTDFAAPTANPSLTQTVQQAATALTLTSTAAPLPICSGDRDADDPGCAPGVRGPKEGPGEPGGPADRDEHGPGLEKGPGLPSPFPGLPGMGGLGGLFGGPHGTVFDRVYVPSGTDVSVPGQPVTFTATVSVTAPGAGTPTGSVTFTDTNAAGVTTTLGTEPVATSNGVISASLTTAALPAGPQTITATYGGDTNFQGSHGSLTQSVEYIFVGLLPPFGGPAQRGDHGGVDPNRTIPVSFILLDASGHPVTTATATLEVNGKPAVPQGHANTGDAFSLHRIVYQYLLRLRDQGVISGTATLTVLTSDGDTHIFTLTVRPAPTFGRPKGDQGQQDGQHGQH